MIQIDHGAWRRHAARHLDAYVAAHLALLFAMALARWLDVIATPWEVVSAPLWLPPVVFVAWRVIRAAVLLLLFVAALLRVLLFGGL